MEHLIDLQEDLHSMEIGLSHAILLTDYAWDNPCAYPIFFIFFWDTLKNPFWGTVFNSVQFSFYHIS